MRIICDDCGSEIVWTALDPKEQFNTCIAVVKVTPCITCINNAYENAIEKYNDEASENVN